VVMMIILQSVPASSARCRHLGPRLLCRQGCDSLGNCRTERSPVRCGASGI